MIGESYSVHKDKVTEGAGDGEKANSAQTQAI